MSGPGERPPRPRRNAAETPSQALARARRHARRAAAEALAAARALLDAAALGTVGRPAEETQAIALLSRALDDLGQQLSGETASTPIVEAVLSALDAEIARWELRSRDDPDARAVLRAFIGLREILWEFGMRRGENESPGASNEGVAGSGGTEAGAPPRRRARRPRAAPRVQRVKVQG